MTTPGNDCRTSHYDVGALIDERYRLTEFVGTGGMACVYKAQEEGAPHTYALKFMKSEYHNRDYLVDFFRDEASSMRDLAHPNIVRFYRFVNHDAYSYIVMDYVEGFSLSDIIKMMYRQNREIPLDEVVRIMVQVARALDAVHREGYVHRDVKPGNVLIDRQTGQAFLTDLGITAAANTRIEGAGTLAYMPPETNETGVADHRADIYSYGIMFFEMLAKRRPFRVQKGLKGDEAEQNLAEQHRTKPVPKITRYRPDLPEALDGIMQQALAKDPPDRYEDILALARDIHTALRPHLSDDMQNFAGITHRQIAAPAPDTDDDSRTGLDRRWPALAGVGLIAAALLVMLLVLTGQATPETTPTPDTVAINQPERTPSVTPSPTQTPTITPTATPNPVEEQPYFPLVRGVRALARPDASDTLVIAPSEDAPLRYLRIGRVDGFRVSLVPQQTAGIDRYGLAFRVEDARNYYLFSLVPASGVWQIETVVDGEATVEDSGTLNHSVDSLVITGRDDFFQIDAGNTTVEFISDVHPAGSLALWVESASGAALELASLSVGLIGQEAVTAADTTPTPSDGIADPRRFLRADVEALLATNDIINSAIDCPDYIDVYTTLDRHLDSNSPTVRTLAAEVINSGEIIFTRCRSESPTGSLSFVDAIQDYLDWEQDLRTILGELRQETG
jgi:serine/threonine protein kinase